MPEGTIARDRKEYMRQWQARRRAAEKLVKSVSAPIPETIPAATLSGSPYNEPQWLPPAEREGREQIEGVYMGNAVFNPHVIFIGIAGRNDPISVHVRDRSNFVRGMRVRAYRDTTPGTAPIWYLNSPLPRMRGRY